ncbi:MAG: efflux RND transporter periplasmic adaptor subunit [Candidatus Saganbacteria bacterium]|nr:efflux RND transporter periplasmic adaptor subunit [Candidatus Saganbacteria bacterium]
MNGNEDLKKKRIVAIAAAVILCIVLYYSWAFIIAFINRGVISASGTIEAIEVQVGSKVSGRVLERYVDEGSNVKTGDPIAKIDIPEITAALRSAKAGQDAAESRSQTAQADFVRISKLYEDGMATRQQYDNANTAADSASNGLLQAEAALETAQSQFGDASIVSPVDGIVLVKAVEKGELVSPGSTIVTVADLRSLELKLYVTEKEVGKIDLGDKVALSVDSFPHEKFYGSVEYIASKAEFTPKNIQTKEERVNQVFEVKVKIPNESLRLKPGMPADAVIELKK